MNTYIVLLRGINVSGQKLIKMTDLRVILEFLNFQNVNTYIQSGNIIFKSEGYTPEQLKAIIEKKIESNYSFYAPAFVFELDDFIKLSQTKPTVPSNINHELLYFVFLSDEPDNVLVEQIKSYNNTTEQFWNKGKMIYLNFTNGIGRAKMNNNFFENKLKLEATARNWRTVNKLIAMAKAISQHDKYQSL